MTTYATTTPVDLRDAILSTCRTHFADYVSQVGPLTREEIADLGHALKTPALMLAIERMTPVEDEAAWRHGLTCSLVLYPILSVKTTDLQGELWSFALAVESLLRNANSGTLLPLHGHDWGLAEAVAEPKDISVALADIGLNGFAALSVNWSQVAYFDGALAVLAA